MFAEKRNSLLAQYRSDKGKGFTLVELLVVVVIIVALAAIAVPIFLNQKEKADRAAMSNDSTAAAKIIANAISTGEEISLSNDTRTLSNTSGDQAITSRGGYLIVMDDVALDPLTDYPVVPNATTCIQIYYDGGYYEAYAIQGGPVSSC